MIIVGGGLIKHHIANANLMVSMYVIFTYFIFAILKTNWVSNSHTCAAGVSSNHCGSVCHIASYRKHWDPCYGFLWPQSCSHLRFNYRASRIRLFMLSSTVTFVWGRTFGANNLNCDTIQRQMSVPSWQCAYSHWFKNVGDFWLRIADGVETLKEWDFQGAFQARQHGTTIKAYPKQQLLLYRWRKSWLCHAQFVPKNNGLETFWSYLMCLNWDNNFIAQWCRLFCVFEHFLWIWRQWLRCKSWWSSIMG